MIIRRLLIYLASFIICLIPIFSAQALDKENIEYWSTPETLIQQINLRGAKSVVNEIYDKSTVWSYILQKIATGNEEWLESAVALREGSDAAASEMLELSVGEALGNNPKNVFTVALKTFGIPAICSGPDVDDARFNSYDLAIKEINRRIEKIATVEDSPLTKECVRYLELSKKGISGFYEHRIPNAHAGWIDKQGNPLPDSDDRKSVGTFGAQLIFTVDEQALFRKWATPSETVDIDTVERVNVNQPINAFIIFSGCKPDAADLCKVSMRFRVIQPDGKVYSETPSMEVWQDKPAPPGRSLELSVQYLKVVIEPHEQRGRYTIQTQVRDNNTDTVLFLQKAFTVTDSATTSVFGNSHEQNIFSDFLYSKNNKKRYEAFKTIVSNDTKYRDIVLAKLLYYQENPDSTPEALIHLAAFLKDQRYIPPLTKMINNSEYSGYRCIYDCPIVFSLVIFACFTPLPLPEDLNENVDAVEDLKRDIKWVKSISLKPEKAGKYVQGPGIDSLLHEIETLPMTAVLELAGPETKNENKRTAAAYVLQYGTVTDTYLAELYWLAITHLKDASHEYQNAIYQAIYRAETARKLKSHN